MQIVKKQGLICTHQDVTNQKLFLHVDVSKLSVSYTS